jgi:hypothetical protein
MMKLLLLFAVLFLATGGATTTIPVEYRGYWCRITDHPYYISMRLKDRVDFEEGSCIKVTARRLEADE